MENQNNNEEVISEKELDMPTFGKRFELLIAARNFHYENYNKWMTYFYVAMSALFIAFYTIAAKSDSELEDKKLLEIALLILGYLISLLWFWSSKGYYYWNINFISMVNHYETDIFKWKPQHRIYKVFYDKNEQNNYGTPHGGANISTSKIAILFAYIVSIFWGFLLSYYLLKDSNGCNHLLVITSLLLSAFTTLITSLVIPRFFLFSKIDEFEEIKKL